MKFQRIYDRLKQYGFSPAKAAEIVLDAERKDPYARSFIGLAFGARR